MINGKAKGANGERELCEWIKSNLNAPTQPTRNLDQTRDGGADVIYPPFAFECKRVENLDLLEAWFQVERAVENKNGKAFGLQPVVAFRKNKQKWAFLISAKFIGVNNGFVQLTETCFKSWALNYIDVQKREVEFLDVIGSSDNFLQHEQHKQTAYLVAGGGGAGCASEINVVLKPYE